MSYLVMVTNDEGEPLGTETLYDDEPDYYDEDSFGPEEYDGDADYIDAQGDAAYPESDLDGEWL